jgi:hypothetical protein
MDLRTKARLKITTKRQRTAFWRSKYSTTEERKNDGQDGNCFTERTVKQNRGAKNIKQNKIGEYVTGQQDTGLKDEKILCPTRGKHAQENLCRILNRKRGGLQSVGQEDVNMLYKHDDKIGKEDKRTSAMNRDYWTESLEKQQISEGRVEKYCTGRYNMAC